MEDFKLQAKLAGVEFETQSGTPEKKSVEELKKAAKPVATLEDLEKVAVVSMQDDYMGKTIADIVHRTGANGFVGSALCDRLMEMNKTVVGLVRDRNYKARRDILDNISVGDIADCSVGPGESATLHKNSFS